MPWQRVIGPPESEKSATSSLASSCQLEDGDLARVRVAEEGDDDVEQAQLPVHRVPELGRVVEHDGGLGRRRMFGNFFQTWITSKHQFCSFKELILNMRRSP